MCSNQTQRSTPMFPTILKKINRIPFPCQYISSLPPSFESNRFNDKVRNRSSWCIFPSPLPLRPQSPRGLLSVESLLRPRLAAGTQSCRLHSGEGTVPHYGKRCQPPYNRQAYKGEGGLFLHEASRISQDQRKPLS